MKKLSVISNGFIFVSWTIIYILKFNSSELWYNIIMGIFILLFLIKFIYSFIKYKKENSKL